MEYILDIVKKIAVFYVIATFLLNLVNDDKYKKYIKMFSGMVIIILVIKPIGRIFSMDIRFSKLFSINNVTEMSDNLKEEIKLVNEKMRDEVISEYKNKAFSDIEDFLYKYSVKLISIDINIDQDGSITNFYVFGSKSPSCSFLDIYIENYDSDKDIVIVELKKYIYEVYKINKNNIYVNISM